MIDTRTETLPGVLKPGDIIFVVDPDLPVPYTLTPKAHALLGPGYSTAHTGTEAVIPASGLTRAVRVCLKWLVRSRAKVTAPGIAPPARRAE